MEGVDGSAALPSRPSSTINNRRMENKIRQYIATWERRCYPDGIPDEAPIEIDDMVPSYKKICIAIMKNDLELLGFSRPKSLWYGIIKRHEIEMRNKILQEQEKEGAE